MPFSRRARPPRGDNSQLDPTRRASLPAKRTVNTRDYTMTITWQNLSAAFIVLLAAGYVHTLRHSPGETQRLDRLRLLTTMSR